MVTKTKSGDIYSMARDLGKRPVTRLIFGGVALYYLSPYLRRFFRNPYVQDFVGQRVEGIRSRIDEVIHPREDRMESGLH